MAQYLEVTVIDPDGATVGVFSYSPPSESATRFATALRRQFPGHTFETRTVRTPPLWRRLIRMVRAHGASPWAVGALAAVLCCGVVQVIYSL